MKARDLSGNTYGHLTVLNYDKTIKGHKYYLCKCDCGKIKSISGSHLSTGSSKSCGCKVAEKTIERNTTHSLSKTRLYHIWIGMKERCLNPNSHAFKNYGGRGIHICNEWLNDFVEFYKWSIANGYSDDLTIERIDVNGNYEPQNCTWISLSEQNKNKRNVIYITINGITKSITKWADDSPVNLVTIYKRLQRGWDYETAITAPDQRKLTKDLRK